MREIMELNEKCTGCMGCHDVCPTGAINSILNDYEFIKPSIQEELCIDCGICDITCPVLHTMYKNNLEPKSYAAYASDAIRKNCSSGGLFPVLAKYIIENKGYVCGAVFNELFGVEHVLINKLEELPQLFGSKYVQSKTEGIYNKVKNVLNTHKVLFIGTPCQVAALNNIVGKEHSNLYTIDLLCHGVPSASTFQKYLHEISGEKQIKGINMRPKEDGWPYNTLVIIIDYTDGTRYKATVESDMFEQCYHYNLFLRESCGDCKFSKYPRQGDISLGDFHGIDEFRPELNDKKGLSCVFCNNKKGQRLYCEVENQLTLSEQVPNSYNYKNRVTEKILIHQGYGRFQKLNHEKLFLESAKKVLNHKYDVGIIGIHTVENHGSNLSYYALYKTICDLGYDVLMIERPKSSWWPPNDKPIIFRENPYDKNQVCDLFNLKDDMHELNKYCDKFVLGSDQLWYYGLYDCFDQFCFMDYIHDDKSKIAYATSFGKDTYTGPESLCTVISYYLKKFDNISVREESGIAVCQDYFDVKADCVLDPVFLCNPQHYYDLITRSIIEKNVRFIAGYMVDPSKNKQNILEYISKEMSLESKCMTDVIKFKEKVDKWDMDTLLDVTNEDWIDYINSSELLVTDSFHGTCFAIIFKKNFITIANEYRGLTRFTSLLEKLGLMDRLVLNVNDIMKTEIIYKNIDYDVVYKLLDEEKEKSYSWLKMSLSKEKKKNVSAYDILDEKMGKVSKVANTAFELAQAQGNVIGAHDERLTNYDITFQNLFKDVSRLQNELTNRDLAFQNIFAELARINDEKEKEIEKNNEISVMKESEAVKRKAWIQFAKFIIIGFSNAFVNLVIYYGIIMVNENLYLVANTIGYFCGILNSFYWNNKFVFHNSSENKIHSFIKTFMCYGITYLFQMILLFIMVDILSWSSFIAPLINIVITTPINFLLNKYWAFKDK